MKFSLSIESDSAYEIGLIADIADIITTEGRLFVSPNSISNLLLILYDGLSSKVEKNEKGLHYITGDVITEDDDWRVVCKWLESCRERILENIA